MKKRSLGVAPLCQPLRVKRAKPIKRPPAPAAEDPRQLSLFNVVEVGRGKKK